VPVLGRSDELWKKKRLKKKKKFIFLNPQKEQADESHLKEMNMHTTPTGQEITTFLRTKGNGLFTIRWAP